MFNRLVIGIFLSFLNVVSLFCASSQLDILFKDMQSYRTTNARFHAGHVYEHSIWVARASINLLASSWRTKCETKKQLSNVVLAALLHDIGKCGDGVQEFNEKPTHPLCGFEYLTGQRPYILTDGRPFGFQALFNELNLSCNDIAFIAIVAGMHHELGGLMRGLNTSDKECFNKTLSKLDLYISKTGYMGGTLPHASKEYKKLIKYICLISAADVISAQVVPYVESHDIINEVTGFNLSCSANARCQGLSDGLNGYSFFKYDTIGMTARTTWLSLCL